MNTLRQLLVSGLAAAALTALPITASKAQAQVHRPTHTAAQAAGIHGARTAAAQVGHHHARGYAVYYRLTPAHPWVWYRTYQGHSQASTAAFNLRARYPTANVFIRPTQGGLR